MVHNSVQTAHSNKYLSVSGTISAAGCRTVQVKIRSEPMGGAVKAPITENRMSDQSFQVGRRFFCCVCFVFFPPNERHLLLIFHYVE